ncbi:MAG: FAD-dependent oxidoreductase [Clostridia bacterium]
MKKIDFVKGKPYFNSEKNADVKQYSYLSCNIDCDVAIVGGGINGAMCAYNFAKAGINCVLIEKERIGFKNTCCATGILEYQSDDYYFDIMKEISGKDILRGYDFCMQGIEKLQEFAQKFGNTFGLNIRDTIIFSTKSSDIAKIKREADFRNSNGYEVTLLDKSNNPLPFDIEVGLLAKNGGADCNAYQLTTSLISSAVLLGARVFENTTANDIIYGEDYARIITNYGYEIKAQKVVCATGFDTRIFTNKKLCTKYITYTITTNPIKNFNWYNNALLKDCVTPYHYIKITNDNRIVIGGGDVLFWFDYICKYKAKYKYKQLEQDLYKLFPFLKGNVTIDYKFCGAFSTTKDNLGLIGQDENKKQLYYCLGYGANGILYAMSGSEMLVDLFNGKFDANLDLFAPNRKTI